VRRTRALWISIGFVLVLVLGSVALFATGTLGGEMFNQFFSKYEMRLELELGSDRARQRINGRTTVTALARFCKQQVRC